MVWVAELLFASIVGGSERANDGVVARSIASGRFAGHIDRHLAAVVRRVASSIGISSEHSTVVSAGTKVNSGAVVS